MTTEPPRVKQIDRPWGSFRQYVHNATATVSLMTVLPGQQLSLQSHKHRAELWIVLDAGAIVQVGETRSYPESGAEIWIRPGELHRLSSAGPTVRVLEIAFGDWQQNDIVRYQDDYGRVEPSS